MSALTDEILARYVALTMLQVFDNERTNREAFRGALPLLEHDEATLVMQRTVGPCVRSLCELHDLDPPNRPEDEPAANLIAQSVLAGIQVGLLIANAYAQAAAERASSDLPSTQP
jgi:hypothetical protein